MWQVVMRENSPESRVVVVERSQRFDNAVYEHGQWQCVCVWRECAFVYGAHFLGVAHGEGGQNGVAVREELIQ